MWVDCVQLDGCQMASVVMGMKYHCVHCNGPWGQVTSQVEHEANCFLMIR